MYPFVWLWYKILRGWYLKRHGVRLSRIGMRCAMHLKRIVEERSH